VTHQGGEYEVSVAQGTLYTVSHETFAKLQQVINRAFLYEYGSILSRYRASAENWENAKKIADGVGQFYVVTFSATRQLFNNL
jgi:hypothetical protein